MFGFLIAKMWAFLSTGTARILNGQCVCRGDRGRGTVTSAGGRKQRSRNQNKERDTPSLSFLKLVAAYFSHRLRRPAFYVASNKS